MLNLWIWISLLAHSWTCTVIHLIVSMACGVVQWYLPLFKIGSFGVQTIASRDFWIKVSFNSAPPPPIKKKNHYYRAGSFNCYVGPLELCLWLIVFRGPILSFLLPYHALLNSRIGKMWMLRKLTEAYSLCQKILHTFKEEDEELFKPKRWTCPLSLSLYIYIQKLFFSSFVN